MKALTRLPVMALLLLLTPAAFAQSQDLVLITVNPCVIFDTRQPFSSAGAFAAEETRSYFITGSTADFPAQGGTSGGCGVPGWLGGQPVAKAIFINYVAIDPQGGGQVKAWAFDKLEPAQGALVNYQALTPPMNNSNGVITELRQDVEGPDIKVRARSAGVHIRGVILGYFTSDHITGVIAGTGLTGGGDSGSVTLGVANGGVTPNLISPAGSGSGQVLRSTGTAVQWQNIPAGPTGSAGVRGPTGNTGTTGPSGVGLSRPVFGNATVDSTAGNTLGSISLTIGADGFPVMTYQHWVPFTDTYEVRIAHCSSETCASPTRITLASLDPPPPPTTAAPAKTAITIGTDGFPLVSYHNHTITALVVVHCGSLTCSSGTATVLDNFDTGQYSSITIGADGLGLISYYEAGQGNLNVAHCNDIACTTATISTLDSTGDVGKHTSITIGADGLGLISYYDVTNSSLKVAHCSNVTCTSATISTRDNAANVGEYTSIAMGWDARGLISYYDRTNLNLKVAHCSDVNCTSVTVATLDNGSIGDNTSIAIGSDGLGIISYEDASTTPPSLKVAHCVTTTCSSATTHLLTNDGGSHSAISIGLDGRAVIAYLDEVGADLNLVHLSDVGGRARHRVR